MTVQFSKEKIGITGKMTKELIGDAVNFTVGWENNDFCKDLYTGQLEAFIMSRLNEQLEIRVYRERPTFWEWITRKRRVFKFEFKAKEVFKNPPKLKKGVSVLMYEVSQRDDD